MQSAIGIQQNQLLQPKTRKEYEKKNSPVDPTFSPTDDVLGIIEYSISEHKLACDFSAADLFRCEMVRVSERGSHIVGSPYENDMDQGEAYERTENCPH